MANEKKRMEAPTESRGVSKQKWLDDRKKKIGKLLDANGLDMTKAYMLDTQEAAEEKYKKWEKDPAPFGWDGMFSLYFSKKCYFYGWFDYICSCLHVYTEIYNIIVLSLFLCQLQRGSQKIEIFRHLCVEFVSLHNNQILWARVHESNNIIVSY